MIVLQENRESPRLNIFVGSSIRCKDEDRKIFSIVRNISSTGVYITTKEQFTEGSVTDCLVSLGDRVISFEGEIVRTENVDPYYGYGIEITDIADRDRDKLDGFIYKTFSEIINQSSSDLDDEQVCKQNILSYDDMNDTNRYLGNYRHEDVNYIETDGMQSRLLQADFPFAASIDDFDFSLQSAEVKELIDSILSLDWIDDAKNIMLFGPTGSGKTHLAIGMGRKAIEQGYKVSFITMDALLNVIKTERILPKSKFKLNKITESRVVIIDEAGMLPLSKQDANLIYQFAGRLYGKTSIVMTSDMTFEQWEQSIGDSDTVNLLLNRLAYNVSLRGLLN